MSYIKEIASIIFKSKFSQKIGKLDIDILSSRIITEEVTLTNNPTEGGFNTDHIIDLPTEISIEGIISTFSIKNSAINRVAGLLTGDKVNRVKTAHDELYRIKNDKQPIMLVTKYKNYSNMVMVSLSMPSNQGDGESFTFNCSFKEARIVTSQLASVSNITVKLDTAKKQTNYGRQAVQEKRQKLPKINIFQFFGLDL